MKIKVKHLGALREAEFTLGELTIICGGNNTGKTYATYALFGFLFTWRRMLSIQINDDQIEQLFADGVIIADTGKKKVILCIEMKAGKGGEMKDIIAQLQGAKCFVAYCREIGKSFWHHPNFLEDYNLRFISIKNIIQKTNTRFNPNRIYPNQNLASKLTILHRSGKSFEFNHLVHCQK